MPRARVSNLDRLPLTGYQCNGFHEQLGLNLKKPLLLVSLLLITGCASPPDGAPQEDPTSTSVVDERVPLEVSEQASCGSLIGSDGGMVSEAGQFLTDVTGLDDATAEESQGIADALDGISQSASDRLQDLLVVMQEPFRELVTAHESGTTFQLDPSRFKAAGYEVIAICAPLVDNSAAQTAGPTTSLKVSSATTCLLLMGDDEDGPLIESVTYITALMTENKQEVTQVDVETSRRLSRLLHEIIETSNDTLRPYIEEVSKPLDMLAAEDSTGLKVDVSMYKAAAVELISQCP